jgi:hypothetical protein
VISQGLKAAFSWFWAVRINSNIKIKGGGQECPPYTLLKTRGFGMTLHQTR